MGCWASCVGGCREGFSREHLVSQGLFVDDRVRVEGLSWCLNGPKEISLASLTAKILCRGHNSDLSPVDTAGGAAFGVFRQLRTVANERRGMTAGAWDVREYHVDGPMLERWLLKTLINLTYTRDLPIGSLDVEKGCPARGLVEVTFGTRQFTGKAGLYFVLKAGHEVQSDDTVEFSPLVKDKAFIIGGLFRFRGFRLLLYLDSQGPPERLTGIGMNGEDWGTSQLNFHNQRIDEYERQHLSQVVYLDW